jgi:hypothetical protein
MIRHGNLYDRRWTLRVSLETIGVLSAFLDTLAKPIYASTN